MTTVKTDLNPTPAARAPFAPTADVPRSNVQDAIAYLAENGGGGGGSGAPTDAEYLVSSTSGDLSNERLVGNSATITWDFSGLGTATASLQHLGLEDLSDPGQDKGVFWDDSEGAVGWFRAGTGMGFVGDYLSITDPDLVAVTETSFTAGDVLYHDGTTLKRLAAGTDGQFLRTRGNTGTAPDWQNIPGGGDMLRANNLSDVTDATAARSNLGLEIGADVQAWAANLDAWALLVPTDYSTTAQIAAAYQPLDADLTAIAALTTTSYGRAFLALANEAAFKAAVNLEIGTDVQAYSSNLDGWSALATAAKQDTDATLTALAGVSTAADKLIFANGADSFTTTDLTAFGRSLIDDANAAAARTTLGLVIGTDVQAYSAVLAGTTASFTTAHETKLGHIAVTQAVDLDAIEARVNELDAAVVLKGGWDASSGSFPGSGAAQAGWSYIVTVAGTVDGVAFNINDRILAYTDNASTSTYAGNWIKLDYTDQVVSVAGRTGSVTLTSSDLTDVTAFSQTLLDDADAASARATLGLTIGTDVQAYDVELAALAGLTSAADGLPYFTGSGSAALATLTAFGRSLIDDADATAGRSTLGLGSLATASTINNDNWSGTDLALANGGTGASLTDPNADRILFWDDSGNAVDWLAPSSGIEISGTSLQMTAAQRTSEIVFVIDGGGSAITTGNKGFLEIPFACTITQATALADQSGSIVVDVWKDTYANYPPTDADSITASAPVTISSATKSQDATLTGWTTSVAAGDVLGFNVDSASTITRVTIALKVTKT